MSTDAAMPGGIAVPPSAELGQRIRARRIELGFRFAKQFAAALGWDPAVLSRLESGQRGVYSRDLDPLCRHMQVTPGWFDGDGRATGEAEAMPATMLSLLDDLIANRHAEVAILERIANLLRGESG